MKILLKKTKIYQPNLLKSDDKSLFNFKGYKLPNTMDLTLWGDYIFIFINWFSFSYCL